MPPRCEFAVEKFATLSFRALMVLYQIEAEPFTLTVLTTTIIPLPGPTSDCLTFRYENAILNAQAYQAVTERVGVR